MILALTFDCLLSEVAGPESGVVKSVDTWHHMAELRRFYVGLPEDSAVAKQTAMRQSS